MMTLTALFLMPQKTMADNGIYDKPTEAFQFTKPESGLVHFRMLLFSDLKLLSSADIGVIDEDGNRIACFKIFPPITNINKLISSSSNGTYSGVNLLDESVLFMTNGTDNAPKWLIPNGAWKEHICKREGSNICWLELDWYYPPSFAGKTYRFYVDGKLVSGKWNSTVFTSETADYQVEFGNITFDDLSFSVNLYDPVPDTEEPKLQLAFSSDKPISGAEFRSGGSKVNLEQSDITVNEYNGFIKYNPTSAYEDVSVNVRVMTATWDDAHENEPSSNYGWVSSEVREGKLPMVHAPKDFNAGLQQDGTVRLTWQTDHNEWPDVFEGDMFSIQRSLSGKDEDFEDLPCPVIYDPDVTDYEFIDETMVGNLQPEHLDKYTDKPNIRYRICRASAQMLWGWDNNLTKAECTSEGTSLTLLNPVSFKALQQTREQKGNYEVTLTWDYEEAGIWDDRAEMKIVSVLKDRDNIKEIDRIEQVLTHEQIISGTATVPVNRSCVNYSFLLVVDSKDSPLALKSQLYDPGTKYELSGLSGSEGFNDDETFDALFDGRLDNKWCTGLDKRNNGVWYVDFKVGVSSDINNIPGTITIYTGNDSYTFQGRNPKHWKLYGTSAPGGDIGSGTLIAEVEDSRMENSNSKPYNYKFDAGGKSYRYYRLEVSENFGSDCLAISEIEMTSVPGFIRERVTHSETECSQTDTYYNSPGAVEQNSLSTVTRPTSVQLKWSLVLEDGEEYPKPVDYFEVLRKIEGQPDSTFTVVASLQQTEWEDRTVSPVYKYIYKVRSVVDCEGLHYVETTPLEGYCIQTGSVDGYVRFADGTGIPGITVSISPNGDETGKSGTRKTVTTDESGYFKADELAYYGQSGQNGSYMATISGVSNDDLQADCQGGLVFSFGTANSSNIRNDVVFTVVKGCKLTGTVLYSGTSIPVKDVSFTMNRSDGGTYEVRSGGKPVTTDSKGEFSFYVLKGQGKVTVQAVKEGHTFDSKLGKFTADTGTDGVAGIYLFDDTRVKLIGRVTGGHVQGELPLGASLSRNNLGEDIKIVMTLEGDNTSWLVYDLQDHSLTERDESFNTDSKGRHKTRMHTTRHRIEIWPDEVTGEYSVMLPPVKWKVQQITAEGYPTLFQPGKTGDVLDMTDSLTLHQDVLYGTWTTVDGNTVTKVTTEYNARYDRIYHSPVELSYFQESYDKFDYFGEKNYIAQDLAGNKATVPLAYYELKDSYLNSPDSWPEGRADSIETVYTFGYPVFSTDRQYPVKLSAREVYYWNNDPLKGKMDIVKLKGGTVTVQNQMVSTTHRDDVQLDENGEAHYVLTAAQTPYSLTGEQALRNVTWTLEMDGVKHEAEPLRAYVMSLTAKDGANDILSVKRPLLVDILRDPPGGGSSATIKKGSTLKYAYKMDLSWAAGAKLDFSIGTGFSMFNGAFAGMGVGVVTGFNHQSGTNFNFSLDIVFSGSGERAFNYTITANEDISTSSGSTMVGADADVYIGMEHNIFAKPAVAVRAIPDSMYRQIQGQVEAGRMVEIAQGNYNGQIMHLVRDEVVAFGDTVTSVFNHSQQYIVKQLLPELAEQCMSMLFTGDKAAAQAQADATKQPVYRLTADINDVGFKDSDKAKDYYEIIYPSTFSKDDIKRTPDRINELCQSIVAWTGFIGQNEKEKLEAKELVRNFDIDGGAATSYSENFTSDYSSGATTLWPLGISALTDQYFDDDDPGNTATAFGWMAGLFGPAASGLTSILSKSFNNGPSSSDVVDKEQSNNTTIDLPGWHFGIKVTPVISYNVTPRHTESSQYNRMESFSIRMDNKSHLDFDVYRVKTKTDNSELKSDDAMNIFVNWNYMQQVGLDSLYLGRHADSDDFRYARSFVYRTRGGATCRPWEGERKTIVYKPGTVLDERTKKIENPVITVDKQSVSGVPYGEPARFKLYLANESEQPEGTYNYYGIYLDESSNPKGAKLLIDGMPLTGDARTVMIVPGKVTEKTLEVYASEDFDYEDLHVNLASLNDFNTVQQVALSVHYLHTAGPVTISTPGDKWIMNTDAAQDSRGYFMPVVISGYDKNQKNFDHIEFQYKESTRGDDYWTNLCSFYANDSLYKLASGTKEMIPGNGYISTRFYGEGFEMEKAYDLRAVLFTRNGNEYLTNASKVLGGIKDTRRPQLFGQAAPRNGILGAGDDITFSFSENVEYNYLSKVTNFEVVGETNETGLAAEPSLLFSGTGFAESDARRNYTDKSVTIELMIKPDDTGQDMPIFSHDADGNILQLWLTKDLKLKAIVGNAECTSSKPIGNDGFQHVAMVIDHERRQLRLYNNSLIGSKDSISYSGYGQLIFGATDESDISKRRHYSGRMLEARIWNRAMDQTLLDLYANRTLTGYEMGLSDYYPMNDGEGDMAMDMAQGAHLALTGATWSLPQGLSLHLDGSLSKEIDGVQVNGLKLRPERFSRSAESDYTLMFWFKTDAAGRGALISNGAGYSTDVDAAGKFFIGFEGASLKYRSNGMELVIPGDYSDDTWHHYAMTVNRAHNTANIYIDRTLRQTFRTDTLGGMTGDDFFIGNMVYYVDGASGADVKHQANALTGNIDELCLFGQALPLSLIKRYSVKSPIGTEKGLITYMSFSRQERDAQNQMVLTPFALSNVIPLDMDGKETERRDTVFADPVGDIMALIDTDMGAPVQMFRELRNLNFNFVGRDNQIMLNINEADSRINKRNVYVTLTDIPDLNGNYMASPVTVSFFVDRNPLRWSDKTLHQELSAGERGEFTLRIVNESGTPHTYTIDNLPQWMTVSKWSDIIEPLEEQQVTFYVSEDLNVGTYDELIYLTSEDGLSEPVAMNLTVKGEEPEWKVSPSMKRYSMSVVAQVLIGNDIVTDTHDIVAAFDSNGECRGSAHIDYNEQLGQALAYLTVYDSLASNIHPSLHFRLWHYSSGKTMTLQTTESVYFSDQDIVGTVKEPLVLQAYNEYVQKIHFEKGWNWISFNVYNDYVRNLLKTAGYSIIPWKKGDILTNDNDDVTITFTGNGHWETNSKMSEEYAILPSECYRVKVGRSFDVEITGSSLTDEADRTITLKKGWNGIGYTPMVNLPIATALADYWSNASDGDLIKSQNEFAMFTEGANGTREWTGSLKYLKPGEGYMLKRNGSTTVKFRYPYYEPGATFIDGAKDAPPRAVQRGTTMTIVATVKGIELEDGDRLVAYSDGDVCGEATALEFKGKEAEPSTLFFLSISGDRETPVTLAIERDGEVIATAWEFMTYSADAISGSPAEPTDIVFSKTDGLWDDGWYTLHGIKLQGKPVESGVYIHNGKKQVVR